MVMCYFYFTLLKELGFFGGKTVLRKQFGEQVGMDDSKGSAEASGAGAWKERKTTCNNPYCSVHGYLHYMERVNSSKQTSRSDSGGDRQKSRVSNAYGVTDDLTMDSDDDSMPRPVKKSVVTSEKAASVADADISAVVRPRRQPLQPNRYVLVRLGADTTHGDMWSITTTTGAMMLNLGI